MNQRQLNCRAMVMAQEILDAFSPCLREEEKRDAFEVLYSICKNGLEAFCIERERLRQRMNPTAN